MKRFSITRAAGFLHDLNVKCYASGVLRDAETNKALYDFYKADFVTESQKEAILEACPSAIFRGAYAEYAPELKGIYICFPKAEMKRRDKQCENKDN